MFSLSKKEQNKIVAVGASLRCWGPGVKMFASSSSSAGVATEEVKKMTDTEGMPSSSSAAAAVLHRMLLDITIGGESLTTWEQGMLFGGAILLFMILLCVVMFCCCGSGGKKGAGAGENSPLLANSATQKLKTMLGPGKLVTLHTSKGPKKVKLTLQRNEIRWETTEYNANKKYKLDLTQVLFVYEGKSTKNLVKANVNERLCVSLISQSSTLDLQVDREDEQVILFRGFSEIIESIKRSGSYV